MPLSTLETSIVDALAEGATLTAVAATCHVHRVTLYRWIRTRPEFRAAIEQARAEHVIALRDQLRDISADALRILGLILKHPKGHSGAVLMKAVTFALTRPHAPHT